MRLLLDTHVLVWWASADVALPMSVQNELESPENQVFFSAVSTAELAIKTSLGKLQVADRLLGSSPDASFNELPLTSAHAAVLADLPLLHRDPFDRMLVAQALVEGLVLVTVDSRVRAYDVPVLPRR